MSYCVSGQTATDSVRVPVKWLREGMKDLIRYDQAKEEISLLKLNNSATEQLLNKTVEFNNSLQSQNKELDLRWKEQMKIQDILKDQNNKNINSLNKQLRNLKIKNTLTSTIGLMGGVAAGVLIGILITK